MIVDNWKVLLATAVLIPYNSAYEETSDLEATNDGKLIHLTLFKNQSNDYAHQFYRNAHHALYGYDGGPGTKNWAGTCSTGRQQSPVDVTKWNIYRASSRRLKFYGTRQKPFSSTISNSGHSVKIKLKTPKPIRLTGGIFGKNVYQFQMLHFHWGANAREGSEHTFNSKRLPLESHFVFHREYSNDPTTEEDGLVVLAVLYNMGWKNNKVLEPVMKALDSGRLTKPGGSVPVSGGPLLRDYLPDDLQKYLTYKGSLTTPPCTEGVRWIVFTRKQQVSKTQVSKFLRITDELGLHVKYNFRETQPLYGRRIQLIAN